MFVRPGCLRRRRMQKANKLYERAKKPRRRHHHQYHPCLTWRPGPSVARDASCAQPSRAPVSVTCGKHSLVALRFASTMERNLCTFYWSASLTSCNLGSLSTLQPDRVAISSVTLWTLEICASPQPARLQPRRCQRVSLAAFWGIREESTTSSVEGKL